MPRLASSPGSNGRPPGVVGRPKHAACGETSPPETKRETTSRGRGRGRGGGIEGDEEERKTKRWRDPEAAGCGL